MCYVSGLASCTIGLVNISDSAFGLTSVNRPHRIDTKYTKSTAEKNRRRALVGVNEVGWERHYQTETWQRFACTSIRWNTPATDNRAVLRVWRFVSATNQTADATSYSSCWRWIPLMMATYASLPLTPLTAPAIQRCTHQSDRKVPATRSTSTFYRIRPAPCNRLTVFFWRFKYRAGYS